MLWLAMAQIIPVALVIFIGDVSEKGFNLFMQKREGTDHLNGCWEFPGGKIEKGELPIEAAAREIKEEVGFDVPRDSLSLFNIYPHRYSERTVSLFSYLFHDSDKALEKLPLKCFPVSFDDEESSFEDKIPAANIKIMSDLKNYIHRHYAKGTWDKLWEM